MITADRAVDVSVVVVTYNHAPFVRQAVESVLDQDSDLAVEVLISEDCSTDGTREIIESLCDEHRDRIRLFLSPRNLNDNVVTLRAWSEARGRFVAIIDGDDYWTDRAKLRKQVEFLEAHPSVFVAGHAVRQVDEAGRTLKESKFDIFEDHHLAPEDLVAGVGCPIPTVSALFRNNGRFPSQRTFRDVPNPDTLMFAYFGNFGAGFVSREVMGVHRLHPGCTWSLLGDEESADLRNVTLTRIPNVIHGPLRALAYYGLFRHSRIEDHRKARRLGDSIFAMAMMGLWLRPRSARYLLPIAAKRFRRAGIARGPKD